MIQTIDFFPPIVDDPYEFGQIAAANALSDVYAMGGDPRLAMNLICYPDCLQEEALEGILQGGCQKIKESGAILSGGHTIKDNEIKYGLSVTGFAHPQKILANATAQEGDLLVLTKPLGIGVLTTGAKGGLVLEEDYRAAVETMKTLNAFGKKAMANINPHACTDITGFGFLGHAYEMAGGSNLTMEIFGKDCPILEGALSLAKDGIIPEGAYRNRTYFSQWVFVEPDVSMDLEDILYDPQTSGGLLIAVSQKEVKTLLHALEEYTPWGRVVGEMKIKGDKSIIIK